MPRTGQLKAIRMRADKNGCLSGPAFSGALMAIWKESRERPEQQVTLLLLDIDNLHQLNTVHHIEEGNDSMVTTLRGVLVTRLVGIGLPLVFAAGCMSASSTGAAGPVPRASAPTSWVDSLMATMSANDKAAQLVWPQVFGDYTPTSTAAWIRVEQLIRQNHVGGFIMSIGSPIETAEKINAMQRLSTLPLVFGADYETGAGFRQRGGYFLPNNIYLGGATMFPPQMALDAEGFGGVPS